MTTALSTERELNKLAKTANREHKACVDSQRAVAEHARDCGLALLEAKRQLAHGEWSAWVSQNCTFSQRNAQRYMLIASRWDELQELAGAKTTRASFFTIRQALKILTTEKSVPEMSPEAKFCPSCGSQLAVTSKLWATCVNCWDCRLYGHARNPTSFVPMTSVTVAKGMLEILEQMDRKQKRTLLRVLAEECGVAIETDKMKSRRTRRTAKGESR